MVSTEEVEKRKSKLLEDDFCITLFSWKTGNGVIRVILQMIATIWTG